MLEYAPLWCKSNYSFLEGASHPHELVETAHRFGISHLAITDRDGVYGIVRAHMRALELGVHLIVGSQVTAADGSHIVLLAEDARGYANLCRLVTRGRLRSPKGESTVTWREVCEHAGHLLALWGGDGSLVAGDDEPDRVAADLREAFDDRLVVMLPRHRRAEEARVESRVRQRATRYAISTIAAVEVLYHTPARRELQDVLTCVRHGVSLGAAGRRTKPNAEHALRTPHAFAELFGDDRESVARTEELAHRCTFSLSELRYRYPSERLPDGKTSSAWLRELTIEGARGRYPRGVPPRVSDAIAKELALIDELDYCGYFLTMWEIVRYCRQQAILCQGRGSAANSAVCYCLGITAVDPARIDLLFERFLSRERNEPPDIDLDIMHERREEVIQHVYEKYGRQRAAMVANVIRYRTRSAVRDVGKALGIPETSLDRLAKLHFHFEEVTDERVRQAQLDMREPVYDHLVALTSEIQNFPRHLSIHPGGFLLGHRPVHDLVPIENGAMADRTVIQWDKDDVEDIGLFKVDLLGLGALTHLERSFELLRRHRGIDVSMHTIPGKDRPTYEMIQRGDTVGVFQIESRAQMAMLPRLRPAKFYDLVIEISIVRPGPITGGMVHPYLRRRQGKEAIRYPHPSLESVLEKTLGVPLFQEQVMRLAVVAADYSPGEADQLRRDMAAWRKTGRIDRHHDRLVRRMQAKGIAPDFAEAVFNQIRGFGEYGFPESHAASFALIAYATSWLKCHHPVEFTCGILNAQPMGFYTPATLIEDARRHGVLVRPVDVSRSEWDCTLERLDDPEAGAHGLRVSADRLAQGGASLANGDRRARGVRPGASGDRRARGRRPGANGDRRARTNVQGVQLGDDGDVVAAESLEWAVRVGLRYVKGLTEEEGRRIAEGRRQLPFESLDDFVRRTRTSKRGLDLLSKAGALRSLEPNRRVAAWEVRGLVADRQSPLELEERESTPSFANLDDFQTINWDYRATDHSTLGHPLEPLRELFAAKNLPDARTITSQPHGRRVRYAGLVICRQRPGTAGGVTFMTLEDETGFVNVVVWEQVFERYAVLLKTSPVLGVTGKLQVEDGVVHIIADELWEPRLDSTPASAPSHDFR